MPEIKLHNFIKASREHVYNVVKKTTLENRTQFLHKPIVIDMLNENFPDEIFLRVHGGSLHEISISYRFEDFSGRTLLTQSISSTASNTLFQKIYHHLFLSNQVRKFFEEKNAEIKKQAEQI